ncbi:MAG: hypothetical protein ACR2QW_13800 [bacterium]
MVNILAGFVKKIFTTKLEYAVLTNRKRSMDKIIESLKAEVEFWQSFLSEWAGDKENEDYKRARDSLRFAELQLMRYEQQLVRPDCSTLQ